MRGSGKLLIGVIFSVVLSGCATNNYGKNNPPSESYWIKPGVSLPETKDKLYNECDFPISHEVEDVNQRMTDAHYCMLNNGFEFMEGGHDLPDNYLPLDPGFMCFTQSEGYMYNSPGCQSYREKHPSGKNWFRRLLGLY